MGRASGSDRRGQGTEAAGRYAWPVKARAAWTLIGLVALLAGVVALRLAVGGPSLAWPETGQVWRLRVDRVLSGVVVGASLATSGVLLQSLLRNPLASPDLIGPASGAGLAVMVSVYLRYAAGLGTAGAGAGGAASFGPAALVGALGALGLVYTLSQRRGFVEPVSLVLVGVIVSIVCGAATMFVAYLMPDRGYGVARWTIGALSDETGRGTVAAAGILALVGIAAGVGLGPAMDVAAMGEDEAQSSGVAVGPLRLVLFGLSGLLTAGAVVLAGPVGFVGLVCPHIVRLLAGPGHRVLVVGAALAGASLIVGADAATKAVNLGGGRMPIGVLTALVGGPVFIVLLRKGGGAGV